MGLKELLFGGYQDTVNDVVGNSYRNEYFKRYSPPYICKMCGKTFSEATRDCTVDHIIPQHLGGTVAIQKRKQQYQCLQWNILEKLWFEKSKGCSKNNMALIIVCIVIFLLAILLLKRKCFGILFILIGILLFPINFFLCLIAVIIGLIILATVPR